MQQSQWQPQAGVNCVIGSGDSGKSTILDAIDLCIGARRNIQVSDVDFYCLNVDTPITISLTLGNLDDRLKNLDSYSIYLRGLDKETGEIEDEPSGDLETILTVRITISDDLEPRRELVSERAAALNQSRYLTWEDRMLIAPSRIGFATNYNLSWNQGSILNKISDERADASIILAKALREARRTFGDGAKDRLGKTLSAVAKIAEQLGIPVGHDVKAMLDAQITSFNGGTISLHDGNGIPLKGLGLGSSRFLTAGLQKLVADQASVVLIDELEHGLEPHRIIRLIDALGAKETSSPLQVFMTTHSPVAVRELSGDQLFVIRPREDRHEVLRVGSSNEVQGTIRTHPEALLAPSIIVCEGPSEVGLLRGVDQYRSNQGDTSITAYGVAIVDGGGTSSFKRANAFMSLGYRISVLKDNDVNSPLGLEEYFKSFGGNIFAWRPGRALEDELFLSLSESGVDSLILHAIEFKGEDIISDHIKSASDGTESLTTIRSNYSPDARALLGKASKSKKNGWFKTVSAMETVARDVVGPDLSKADTGFRMIMDNIFKWISYGRLRD